VPETIAVPNGQLRAAVHTGPDHRLLSARRGLPTIAHGDQADHRE
jgi:hypothetical protein